MVLVDLSQISVEFHSLVGPVAKRLLGGVSATAQKDGFALRDRHGPAFVIQDRTRTLHLEGAIIEDGDGRVTQLKTLFRDKGRDTVWVPEDVRSIGCAVAQET